VILELENLGFSFGYKQILKDVSFCVPEGAIVSLVGPNGSGKTTLLRCIVRALRHDQGRILVDGRTLAKSRFRDFIKRIGYVPQIEGNGFPVTVFDAVLLGRKPYISWNPSQRDLDVVSDTLMQLGLDEFALREMNELSGGEKQKVLIARAIANEPHLLVLDEPTSSLDLKHQVEILDLISSLSRDRRISVIMAMHDLNLATMYSDRLVMLKEGSVMGDAPPSELLTADIIRSLYGVDVSVSKENGMLHVYLNHPSKAGRP
jgi:iron complex transport system ATP-binding protein